MKNLRSHAGSRTRTLTTDHVETASTAAKARYDAPIYPLLTRAWGGEMIHIGLFDGDDEPLSAGLARSNRRLADAAGVRPETQVVEVACGVGGVATHLARTYGCRVRASNIAETQLERATELVAEAGLEDHVTVEWADFHDLPYADGSFDCWWSQDSLYHGGNREHVLREAYRVLRPGGRLVLSDFTLNEGTPADERAHIEEVVGGPAMWSYARYRATLEALGFRLIERFHGYLPVCNTFRRVRARFERLRDDPMARAAGDGAFEQTLYRLGLWIEKASAHRLGWGYWVAKKPD